MGLPAGRVAKFISALKGSLLPFDLNAAVLYHEYHVPHCMRTRLMKWEENTIQPFP